MARTPDIAAENAAAADAFASAPSGIGVEIGRAERQPFILFRGPWWIVPALVGLATVAACVLLPLREENATLAHQLAEVQQEADFVARQTAANDAFLKQVHDDPALVERIAMRMTNRPAAGMKFLNGRGDDEKFGSSPYQLTQLAAPAAIAPYQSDLPLPIRALFGNEKSRLVMLAGGVFLLASALVLGGEKRRVS